MERVINDVLIVGAGPAGLSAAIYLIRSGYDVTILEKGVPGGKVNLTAHIENYPGIEFIDGPELAFKMYEHATKLGAKIISKAVLSIEKEDDVFVVKTKNKEMYFKSVIIASGTKENKLEVEGAENFENKGISYCAVCDGRFFKDKPVAVIGGGNAALEEALYLEKICSKVYLIHRRQEFRAEQYLIDKVKNSSIELVLDCVPSKIIGDNIITQIEVSNVKNEEKKVLDVNGVFPFIGAKPNTDFISNEYILDEKGYIVVNEQMETLEEGLFACGDVVRKELRQIITAASDGAIAAISVANYLKK